MKISDFVYMTMLVLLGAGHSLSASEVPAVTSQAAAQSPQGAAQLTLDELRTFTDVFNEIRRNYVEKIDDKTLLDAAIKGMLTRLDPHSAYLPNKDFEDLETSARGQYIGLGFDVGSENGRIVIRHVINPSPADSAGINPGDIIIAIDGKPVKDRPFKDITGQLDGKPGTSVELTIQTPDGKTKKLTLKREFVKLPALTFRLMENHYGYVRIVYFHRQSATDLKSTLESVREAGTQLYGLILDLRNNPGGVLQPAIEIADGFLDRGDIVSTRGRNATMQLQFSAQPGQWLPNTPLVLLVDRGSASASEVLAGALQDNGRAVIVGEPTFGKGSVQSVLPLRNGAGLKLTTARYYTPSGRSIQAQGIVPDIRVAGSVKVVKDADDRRQEADLKRHLSEENVKVVEDQGETVSVDEDYPLHEALNLLRATHILSRLDQQEKASK